MAEITPFQILNAFSAAGILCSMGYGPDGLVDSGGAPYQTTVFPSTAEFVADLVEEAGSRESVVLEFRNMPESAEDGTVTATYTMREQIPQGKVAMK